MKLRVSYQPGTCDLRLDNMSIPPNLVSWFALYGTNSDLDILLAVQKLGLQCLTGATRLLADLRLDDHYSLLNFFSTAQLVIRQF